MAVTGSIAESEYRSDLIGSKRFLLETKRGRLIVDILKNMCGDISSAYVIAHTPEQGEDIFRILVNGKTVVGFELPHGGGDALDLSETPVNIYESMLKGSKEGRLRLAVAMSLAKSEMLSEKN